MRPPRTGGAVIEFAPGSQEPEVRVGGRHRRKLFVLAALVVVVLGIRALRGSKPGHALPAAAVAVRLEGGKIRFSEEFAGRHRITSIKVAESELAPVIDVMGTVRHDVRKFAAVGARSAGRVRRVFKITGDLVKPGDVLADIESVDVGRAQAAAEALRAKEVAAETNLAREQHLAEAKVTAVREAESAKAEHQALRAERRAAEKAVAALGAGMDSAVGILKLRSPIAGRVLSASVSQGQTVEPRDTLFEVADLSTVWVELIVFERDLYRVKAGDVVELHPAGGKGVRIQGTVAHVADVVDPSTRSALVRVEVDNREGRLRPGQSTSARIQSRAPAERALVLPKAAITFVDGKPTAMLLVAPGLVEPRPVELGPDDGERVVVRQGVRADDSVIVEGVFALKSELYR